MDTVDFLEKGRQYAKERYPDEYSDKADGRIVHAFVDGAIYATVAVWKRIDRKSEEEIKAIREALPVILLDTDTFGCAFAFTNASLDSSLAEDNGFTHWMPVEIPPDAWIDEDGADDNPKQENPENDALTQSDT